MADPAYVYNIREVPQDQRILSGQKYRKQLYYVAQAAVWTSYLYIALRLLALILSISDNTFQIWAMALTECFFIYLSQKEQLLTIKAGKLKNGSPRKRLRLEGNENLPHVDIFVTCCNEPTSIILATVRAACTLDYPTSCFRVLVLDDGGSASLKKAISELKTQWNHLQYHSRGRQSGMVFAKSGNLNYALTSLQEDKKPEFCLVLDADSVPKIEFLRATLPHLLENPNVSLVSTRQYFFNLPDGDPLSQSRSHFYTCQNAELDILGRAIDAGSGAVFRRKSIIDVGLYPTFSFSEDWQLSQILHGMGHRTLQVQEPLQFGLVPTSITGHSAQRNRWNIGHAQQVTGMISSKSNHLPKRLRWSIACNGLDIVAGELGSFLAFLVIPLLCVSGPLIPLSTPSLVTAQILLGVCQVSVTWIYENLQAASTGYRSAPFAHMENKWLAGSNIYGILRFYLGSGKPKGSGSFITGSTANSWNHAATLSRWTRLYHDLLDNGIFYNSFLLVVTIGTLLYSVASAIVARENEGMATQVLTTIAFPPLLHISWLSLSNNYVPVAYIFNPPRYPDRRLTAVNDNTMDLPGTKIEKKPTVRPKRHYMSKELFQPSLRLEIDEPNL
ncbi:hypothetical protein N7462_005402 [Penicillium macrosclerotiorum]|uniref:uncharacterized protein n=1 Tax=Penicillium macrosclerotiorum TaxID=303699 RepID=UPI0025470780|nr:uncharacterized protein N7462_005402 [Penicillium macrosclerotiorum]KAJ5682237.1 hypothetical protein N7462_005402 [Penicillium macrosclerotiorum]